MTAAREVMTSSYMYWAKTSSVAKYNLATVYIVGRVEAGEYPLAIAYSLVLILLMATMLIVLQRLIGETRLGRRAGTLVVTGN